MPFKKIAIVYDWIDKWGGVERVLLSLHELFPDADFFTSSYDPEKAVWASNLKINTSFIQKLPKFVRGNRPASLPFYPYAFESFDFTNYDLVISVTSAFAKSIITRPETLHICYLLTPTRFLWVNPFDYIRNSLVRSAVSPYVTKLREWDFVSAQRPDRMISISQTVADRCKKYYQRNSEIIYPPFDIEYWRRIKSELRKKSFRAKWRNLSPAIFDFDSLAGYFLIVSRLEPYKRVDVAIETFNSFVFGTSMQRPLQKRTILKNTTLIVAGEGSESNRLKQMANKNVLFLNNLSDHELAYLYSNAEAIIMPQEEDFGYVSLEAQFFGCPVIAYKQGGAGETVIEGKTGIFFAEQSRKSLQSALNRFNMIKYELKRSCKEFGLKSIARYDKKIFEDNFLRILNEKVKNKK